MILCDIELKKLSDIFGYLSFDLCVGYKVSKFFLEIVEKEKFMLMGMKILAKNSSQAVFAISRLLKCEKGVISHDQGKHRYFFSLPAEKKIVKVELFYHFPSWVNSLGEVERRLEEEIACGKEVEKYRRMIEELVSCLLSSENGLIFDHKIYSYELLCDFGTLPVECPNCHSFLKKSHLIMIDDKIRCMVCTGLDRRLF